MEQNRDVATETQVQQQPPAGLWSRVIPWHRTPLDPKILKELQERSDFLGLAQTFGYLGVLALTGGLALYSAGHWPLAATVGLTFLHGTCFAFQINAVHELGHGTVFRTKWLNPFFERVFSFLGWINFEHFDVSHRRHHQYTLHPPDDLEVTLPIRLTRKNFFESGFVNPRQFVDSLRSTLETARGKFTGKWSLMLFPESAMEKRAPVIRWARVILAGHGLIGVGSLVASFLFHYPFWMVAVLVSLAPCYGGWLFFLCNNTQHIGLKDQVPDFRLNSRTILLNPVVQFLYWHMNYHIEHHMYAAVPCYRLGRLRRLIQHDLPSCPPGIVAAWKEIADIQSRQAADPNYQYVQPLPT